MEMELVTDGVTLGLWSIAQRSAPISTMETSAVQINAGPNHVKMEHQRYVDHTLDLSQCFCLCVYTEVSFKRTSSRDQKNAWAPVFGVSV